MVLKDEMIAVASFGDDPTKIEIILPPGDPQLMLAEVATKPGPQLFGTIFSYSYPQEELEKRPRQPANTLIEMSVPYCFHIPDNVMLELKQANKIDHLVFKKVWTTRAKNSSDADFRSPTHVLFHNKISMRTPSFPTDPTLGPECYCEGTNVEAIRDRDGIYRYSLVWLFVNTDYSRESLTSKAGAESARATMIAYAIAAINRFIDIYRIVTNTPHVQRLSSVYIRDLFFREHNIGFHGASFGHGICTAVMNRPDNELRAISQMAATAEEIETWELLFLDATAALGNNSFTLAVVNAFQALELRLEAFLEKRMFTQGLTAEQIEEKLGRIWRTKERLKDLVPSVAGRTLIDDDPKLWDRFSWAYDQIRNKLIHSAQNLNYDQTENALTACRGVSQWLNKIS